MHTEEDINRVEETITGTLTGLQGATLIHQIKYQPNGTVTAKKMPSDETNFPVRVYMRSKGVGL